MAADQDLEILPSLPPSGITSLLHHDWLFFFFYHGFWDRAHVLLLAKQALY